MTSSEGIRYPPSTLPIGLGFGRCLIWVDVDEHGITLHSYAESLIGLRRTTEAEPLLIEAYGIMAKALGENDRGAQRIVATLVRLYEETGRAASAAEWQIKLAAAAQ